MTTPSFEESHILKEGEDFITQVARYISNTTMTSIRWAEDLATSLLSTVMGPDRYISNIKGKLPLNVWYMAIGPSGLAHKTLPLKTYFVSILLKTTEKLPNQYPLILPSKWSVEGFIEYMTEHSVGCMYRDEFTSMFKEAYNKDYLADSLEFLSELYDGTIQKRTTRGAGTHDIRKVFVTFVSATTPYLYKILKIEFYIQGTGNRILLEIFNEEDMSKTEIDSETFFQGPKFESHRENFIDCVAENLAAIRDCNIQYLVPDEASAKIWTQYELDIRTQSIRKYKENPYNLNYSYMSRLPEMALKLSGLYAISRIWDKVILSDAPPELIVLERDMNRAITKANHHYAQFCKMLEQWRSQPMPATVRTFEEQSNFILDKLQQNPNGLSWTELRRVAKWDTYSWREALKYLHQTDKIIIILAESSGGRKPIVFYDNKPNVVLAKGITFTDWRTIEDWLGLR